MTAEQLKLVNEYDLDNTFLLQYDAVCDADFVSLFKENATDKTELGLWYEIVEPLTSACGIECRSEHGWKWDWHIIPGFSMHYLLEAVYRLGLREKYTLQICERWKAPVLSCSKGLVEGFVAPEPTYQFDHSHAWGGTPLYSLPKAIMGLEITKPGMREIELSPSLLGLNHANIELLTPYGKVVCEMKEGEKERITHPKEVRVILK